MRKNKWEEAETKKPMGRGEDEEAQKKVNVQYHFRMNEWMNEQAAVLG